MSQDYDFLTHTLSGNNPAGSFPEIQELFEAVLSSHLGTTAPATTRPGMPWFDSNAGALKIRNAGNTAWILVGSVSGVGGLKTPDADRLDGQHGAYYDDVPNATSMLFYQAAAPTGWTQDTSVNDRVLRVVSGAGGGTGGSWTISGLGLGTLSAGRGTLSVNGHTLTLSQIPNATGYFRGARSRAGQDGAAGVFSHSSYGSNATGSGGAPGSRIDFNLGGGGNSHSHGMSGNPSMSGAPNHNGSWRPSYIDTIVATRSK